MLQLARKMGERVRITGPGGELAWVEVLSISRSRIVLGFVGDRKLIFRREECHDRDAPICGNAGIGVDNPVPNGVAGKD